MSKHTPRSPSLLKQAEADSLSAVHLWLKQHRRQVASLCEDADAPWVTVARRMEAEGVRNKSGEPPSADLIRKTWKLVVARHEKKEAERQAAKAAGSASTRRHWRRPNVEPPSRPPEPDTGIRFPTALTEEPPGWRERYPETYGRVVTASAPPVAPSSEPVAPEPQLHTNPKIAAALKTLQGMGEYVPPPIVRRKII